MKRRLAIVVIAVMTAAGTVPALAQSRRGRIIIRPQTPNPHGPRGRYIDVDYPTPEKRAANLAELLNLSGEQKQKVQEIFVEQDTKTLAVWDETLTTDAREKKITQLREAAMKKVRDLLTADQKKKYDALGAPEKPDGR